MKRAAFRLEPVLRVRAAAERAASLAHAEAVAAAHEAGRRVEEQVAALQARTMPGSLSGPGFVAAMVASRAAAADVVAARSMAQASAEHAELLRERWTAAAQATKALEKLRDRHELAARSAEDAAEARAIDDLVTRQHAGAADDETREEDPWTG
ncbi:flagellar export protein FliJ [Blastococcus sp. SYSU D00820]